MRYIALATDYDGTIAHDGVVDDLTLKALDQFRQTGRKLILVTGRELLDLEAVFPNLGVFDCIVAENGAVLYTPATREKQLLADPPNSTFIEALKSRGVQPLSVGESIVATWTPNESTVLDVIRNEGLELQVVFNKGAVMILPAGINKMSGLKAALDTLGLSPHNIAGIGDAENDHAFLKLCEFSAAVFNALPSVKETADLTTQADHGAGVVELVRMIIEDDLAWHEPRRRAICVGRESDKDILIRAFGSSVLVAGASGSGKSTFIAGLLESFIEKQYQVCLIDPEGDYDSFPNTITIGDEKHAPSPEQVLQGLGKPASQIVVSFTGLQSQDRPGLFSALLPRVQELRLRSGRPHWIIIDEAHHMLPAGWAPGSAELAGGLTNMVMITVHPDHVAPAALKTVDVVIAVGRSPEEVFRAFAEAAGVSSPRIPSTDLESGEGLVWFTSSAHVHRVKLIESHSERKRHQRKYALGELAEDRSFYFRGRDKKLNLRAQNLVTFLQLSDGVDDDTWLYHLRCGDYSRWFRENIKDDALAQDASQIEKETRGDARTSRERIKEAIERRYTAPA